MSQRVAIKSIKIGERRRDEENLGDIEGLAKSISEVGLIHPIVVDTKHRLIAGRRRLEACKRLGHKMIECTLYTDLTEEELRAIELDENERRKDLTAYERSKNMVEKAELAVERETKSNPDFRPKDGRKSRGRPRSQKSSRTEAKATEESRQSLDNAKRHVAACERYPLLAGAGWSQKGALRAAALLDEIPARQRRAISDLVSQFGIPPDSALRMIETFGRLSEHGRDRLLDASRSKDSRLRSAAGTFLAGTAAEPDPRAVHLSTILHDLKKFLKRFPEDPLNPKLERLIAEVEGLREKIGQQHKERLEELTCQLQ